MRNWVKCHNLVLSTPLINYEDLVLKVDAQNVNRNVHFVFNYLIAYLTAADKMCYYRDTV